MVIKNMGVLTCAKWLEDNEAILIDVRENFEFENYRIAQGQFAPLSNLPEAILGINAPPDKKIIVYCLKGGRSAQAIDFLSENIFKDHELYNMEGGILSWMEAGLPVVNGE